MRVGWIWVLLLTIRADAEPPRYETRKEHDPDGTGKFYMGREIAQVMGHPAAGWLERPEREREEQPTKLLKLLDVKAGQVIADVGAGSGYHAVRLAKLVGETGKVLAVDIQQEMLDLIIARAKSEKISNIETILGMETDPKLPREKIDMILMVDVYHEFSHPYEMMEKMVAALKPGGRIVLVEFKPDDPKVPIKPVHTLSEKQAVKELTVFPELEHVKTVDVLPWQNVIFFEKASAEKQKR